MMGMVLSKVYSAPLVCEKEILRYAGCKSDDSHTIALINKLLDEAQNLISYRVCYCKLPLSVNGDRCNIGDLSFDSKDLAKNLEGCNQVIIFAATLGAQFDRLIEKYSRISPSSALILQAIGAERIEALCDAFCQDLKAKLKPRFSAGYGDLSLEVQKDIFALLDCQKHIGLTLTDRLIMCPSKSVTAIVGIID